MFDFAARSSHFGVGALRVWELKVVSASEQNKHFVNFMASATFIRANSSFQGPFHFIGVLWLVFIANPIDKSFPTTHTQYISNMHVYIYIYIHRD